MKGLLALQNGMKWNKDILWNKLHCLTWEVINALHSINLFANLAAVSFH